MKSSYVDLMLLCLIYFMYFGLTLASPKRCLVDWFNACHINDWSSVYLPSAAARKPMPWCPDQRDRISALMRSMHKNTPKTSPRFVPATAFGTNVQLYYMRLRDEFLINPVIESADGEMKKMECQGIERMMHTVLRVKYINSYFHEQVTTFTYLDAMIIECELVYSFLTS